MSLAPIVLFVYNRPRHTELTLNALAENGLADQSVLHIYADGPKRDASPETLEKIKKTRELVHSKNWCKEVRIIESETNKGLADSIISGVSEVINEYGKVIVLEDDLITSKYFLKFMNDALDTYFDEQRVISIGALNFFATDDQVSDTFFIPIPDCWGWATWKNRWALFEPNPQKLLNQLRERNLTDAFNLYGACDFEKMLIDQIKGNINSWAVRWQAVAYLENKLTLYPKYSVTKNIGFDTEGTHGGADRYSKTINFAEKRINVEKIDVTENPVITAKMTDGYFKVTQPARIRQLKLKIRHYIKLLLPPFVSIIYRKTRRYHNYKKAVWSGDFTDWASAKKSTFGYEAPLILEKTKNAVLKVINGEAAFERDTVLFTEPEYNWPLLTILMKAGLENNNKLSVLDFGGSLGSVYFQNLSLLQSIGTLESLEWSVVEQNHYVNTGNEFIANQELKFYSDIEECLQNRKPTVLLLSSVLQYLENPYLWISKFINLDFDYIVADKTLIINHVKDRLTIQNVPEDIYPASYPAWFFNRNSLLSAFEAKYKLLSDFESYPGYVITLEDKIECHFKGFIFKKKTT